MPMPVSATAICRPDASRLAVTVTAPPSGVNLIAFETRFRSICRTFPASALMAPASPTSATTRIAFCVASGSMVASTCSTTGAISTVWRRSSI